jgi:hypothetical protein
MCEGWEVISEPRVYRNKITSRPRIIVLLLSSVGQQGIAFVTKDVDE